jgi:hypothetical protein
MSRSLLGLFILGILLLGVASLSPEWLIDVCAPALLGERVSLSGELRRGEQLARESQAMTERLHIKGMVIEELLSGKLTLFEAAAKFRSLDETPRARHNLDYPRPGRDDGERWCRLVIDWFKVDVRFSYSPTRADAVCRRLERELREHLQRHGTVKLPDVAE